MAKEQGEAEVVLDDEATVTLDLSDDPELAAAAAEKEEEEGKAEEPKKINQPRIPLRERREAERTAAEEATKALQEAKEKAERDAAAALSTAAQERARREAAERQAAQSRQEAEEARSTAEQTQITLLDKGIESAESEVEAYEGQLASAYESGDFKLVAQLQTKLSKATATLDRLQADKEKLASAPKTRETTEGRVDAPAQQSAFEQYVSRFAPEAQAWLRSHPECVPAEVGGSHQANAKMMAGHYAAMAQNLTPNSAEYFRVIEEHTGHRQPTSKAADLKPAGDDEGEQPARQQQRQPQRQAQPSAPPSREPPSGNGGRSTQRTVTLSKEQQEMAKLSFPNMKPQEAFAQYARNMLELEAEGKLGRTTH